MSGTIRSRMEAQRDRHTPGPHPDQCPRCHYAWPCADWAAADDTLTDLNNAERRFQGHDPENGGDVVYRLIPDHEGEA